MDMEGYYPALHYRTQDMSVPAQTIYLPDTMSKWPWPKRVHPEADEVKAACIEWFRTFKAFTPQSQAAFEKCDFPQAAALICPGGSKEFLRTHCDLMILYFVIDHYTDVEDGTGCKDVLGVAQDALHNPHKPRPDGEVVLGEITRQFWELAIQTTTPIAQRRFVESFSAYLASVVEEAADRDTNTIRSTDAYLSNRRDNVGTRPDFALLAKDLPDEVFYHPLIVELCDCVTEMVIIDNDIISYNMEQASGNGNHNIVTISMHELNVDIETAITRLAQRHTELQIKFMDYLSRMPPWDPDVDRQAQEYILCIANWPRGVYHWQFESGRYFDVNGSDVEKTRHVPLLPQFQLDTNLRRERVVIPLPC